jgi:hypothetical protein
VVAETFRLRIIISGTLTVGDSKAMPSASCKTLPLPNHKIPRYADSSISSADFKTVVELSVGVSAVVTTALTVGSSETSNNKVKQAHRTKNLKMVDGI